jgi:hypothetical protein
LKRLARNFNKDLTPRSRPGSSVLVVGPDSLVVGLFASLPEGGASVSGSEPRSGVRGLTPFQVRFQALENGWAALPIVRHDAADKGAGKRPVIAGWEAFAEFGADLPTLADLNDWDARFGHAPGTGLPMGNEVAIELVFLRDPTLAKRAYDIAVAICGETPFVRQGQAPKTALVYRAAEPIETIRLKADDGSGEGLDVLGGGAQLWRTASTRTPWSPTSRSAPRAR